MLVRFWGVRGSIACPGATTVRYGGNTACVEVKCDERRLIFDAGTGLYPLGQALVAEPGALPVDADIFLSHCHLDHVCGLPFFEPAYMPDTRLAIWAGNLLPHYSLEEVLGRSWSEPLFPGGGRLFKAAMAFNDFRSGEPIDLADGLRLRTAPLAHPNGATGYRLDYRGRSLAYVTDTEHQAGLLDAGILGLIEGADLMIYDCTYTDAEFPAYTGRGHSTWQQAARLAEMAGVRRLALSHHDPSRSDAALDRIAAEARDLRAGTLVAAEGCTISIENRRSQDPTDWQHVKVTA